MCQVFLLVVVGYFCVFDDLNFICEVYGARMRFAAAAMIVVVVL